MTNNYKSEILRLSSKARKGDKTALNELYELNRKLSIQSNANMRALKREGYTSSAYKWALNFNKKTTGGKRFRYGKTLKHDVSALKRNALAAAEFQTMQTSTVEGYRELEEMRLESLEKFAKLDVADKEAFLDFMRTEAFTELMKLDSSRILDFALENITERRDISQINRLYNQYKKGKIEFPAVFEKWTGVSVFDYETERERQSRSDI